MIGICHAIVGVFMLHSTNLEYKDLQFLDYCPVKPVACVDLYTTTRGVGHDITSRMWCANADKRRVYDGDVAEMKKS